MGHNSFIFDFVKMNELCLCRSKVLENMLFASVYYV